LKKSILGMIGEPDVLFALIVIFYLAGYLYLINGLQSIPTCLTCDYYFEQGNVLHLVESFNAKSDSSTHLGHLSQGPQLTYFLPMAFVWLTGKGVFTANLALSFIIIPISLLIYYKLFQQECQSKAIALACTTAAFSLSIFPLLKYSEYTIALSIPLFFWFLTGYFRKPSIKSALLLGVGIGIMGLSHANAFFLAYILVFSFMAVGFFFSADKKSHAKTHWPLILACAIGFLISLSWWYRPLFAFGGNPYLGFGFNTPDLSSRPVYFLTAFNLVKYTFFNMTSLHAIIFSVIWTLGVFSLAFNPGFWKKHQSAIAVLLAFFIATFHFLITAPLFGKDISPAHSFMFLYPVATGFLLLTLLDFWGNKAWALALAIALLLVIANLPDVWQKKSSALFSLGFAPIDACLASLSGYVMQNAGVNDVFLSTSYSCNTLNGLTGRKCLQMDRGHSSKFDSMDESYVDAAIIIFGASNAERGDLLEKNKVAYFYWNFKDNPLGDNAIIINNLVIHANPIIYSEERERMLVANGVSYSRQNTYLDSSMGSDYYKKFDAIVLHPQGNVYNASHPWNPELDRHLEEVWSCGNTSVLYRIKKGG
jgi:hypothetical protein